MTRGKHAARAANHRAEQATAAAASQHARDSARISELQAALTEANNRVLALGAAMEREVNRIAEERVAAARAEAAHQAAARKAADDRLVTQAAGHERFVVRIHDFLAGAFELDARESYELIMSVLDGVAPGDRLITDGDIRYRKGEAGLALERSVRPRPGLRALRARLDAEALRTPDGPTPAPPDGATHRS